MTLAQINAAGHGKRAPIVHLTHVSVAGNTFYTNATVREIQAAIDGISNNHKNWLDSGWSENAVTVDLQLLAWVDGSLKSMSVATDAVRPDCLHQRAIDLAEASHRIEQWLLA